jgi:hypothetical protein
MIKLILLAVIVLTVLGSIVFFIFSSSKPEIKSQIPFMASPKSSATTTATSSLLSDIKVADIKIKQPPTPLSVELFAPKQKTASGYVRFSEVTGKILIQLKSDSPADTSAFIFSGACTGNGKILYPLVSLKEGQSQTIWEINMEQFKKQLPLSVKVYEDLKNLKTYSRCADLKG